jgi:uncharacterized membrane protein YbhN (UPF0104 family)
VILDIIFTTVFYVILWPFALVIALNNANRIQELPTADTAVGLIASALWGSFVIIVFCKIASLEKRIEQIEQTEKKDDPN